jgi:hypothetical protein
MTIRAFGKSREEEFDMAEKTLGILEIENEPMKYPGTLAGPGTFQFPIKRITVPGATGRKLVDGDRSVKDTYVKCARQLENNGVAAIISNCGFSSVFQADVSAAVSVPVALSSLLLVPFVARTVAPEHKIGIITYDAGKLTEEHFAAAGWSSKHLRVAVAGIEGSESWSELMKPVPDVVISVLIKDVVTAATALVKAEPDVAALLLECAAFPITADTVRRETGLRVADYRGLANMLVEMSPPRR